MIQTKQPPARCISDLYHQETKVREKPKLQHYQHKVEPYFPLALPMILLVADRMVNFIFIF